MKEIILNYSEMNSPHCVGCGPTQAAKIDESWQNISPFFVQAKGKVVPEAKQSSKNWSTKKEMAIKKKGKTNQS